MPARPPARLLACLRVPAFSRLLTWHPAALLQDAYLDVTLPVLGATLRALESEHRQAAGEADQRLQKRLKYLGSKRGGGQGDAQGELS